MKHRGAPLQIGADPQEEERSFALCLSSLYRLHTYLMLTSSSKLNNCSLGLLFLSPFLPFHFILSPPRPSHPRQLRAFLISSVVALAMIVVAMMAMVGRREQGLPGVVVSCVGEDTILDVAAEDALLGEGDGVLDRVVSPAHHSAEEERAVRLLTNVLVQVVLEELLGAGVLH